MSARAFRMAPNAWLLVPIVAPLIAFIVLQPVMEIETTEEACGMA